MLELEMEEFFLELPWSLEVEDDALDEP